MCEFFSFVTNGRGKYWYFKEEDIIKIQKEGNKENLDYNSHASICSYFKIDEDRMNKYEYDPETKEFKIDQINSKKDDSKEAEEWVRGFWKDSKIFYMKLCKGNSGDWNSGYWNSGNGNSGDWNSGYLNSGNRNSGNRNSGNGNSGNRNSGNRNSGDWNSGNGNSGYLNSDKSPIRIFNKFTKKEEIDFPEYFYFDLTQWIYADNMTQEEKDKHKGKWEKPGGYLKTRGYKEAWKNSFEKAVKEDVALTLKLPNFNYKIFEEITGITKKMLTEKLGDKNNE